MALNKACHDAVFLSFPKAGHGVWNGFFTDDAIREGRDDALDERRRLRGDEPDADHPDVEDGDRVPRQAHEAQVTSCR